MTPSQLMEKKRECVDVVWDLLTYLYMLGYDQAMEEVGQPISDLAGEFLPSDYATAGGEKNLQSGVKGALPKEYSDLTDEQKKEADKEIYKKFKGENFIDRVMKYAELGNASDIIRVAETDGNRVYNFGGLNGAIESGAKFKTWNTMEDEKVRETHDVLDKLTVPVQDKFITFDGDEANIPCGFSNPANNVNCRCWLTFSK